MDLLTTLLPLLLLVGVFYFLLYRPTKMRNAEIAATQAALAPGARVMMGGGLHGVVVSLDDDEVVVQAAPGVELHYSRQGVVKVLEPAPDTASGGTTDPSI
jgi:preprotein translocase subunit YajC